MRNEKRAHNVSELQAHFMVDYSAWARWELVVITTQRAHWSIAVRLYNPKTRETKLISGSWVGQYLLAAGVATMNSLEQNPGYMLAEIVLSEIPPDKLEEAKQEQSTKSAVRNQ